MPASGLRSSRTAISLRSTSTHSTSVDGDGGSLVGRLFQHGGEAEEFADGGLVDHDFLSILIDRGHADGAGDDHVSVAVGVAGLIDPLARVEALMLHLAGQDGGFFIVEQGKERHLP